MFGNSERRKVRRLEDVFTLRRTKQLESLSASRSSTTVIMLGVASHFFKCWPPGDSKRLVFSSSCTVYGGAPSPVTESSSVGVGITNAYAQTKYTVEQMLRHVHGADASWQIAL